jgi:tetratricopeptide (TPR) repeat protein
MIMKLCHRCSLRSLPALAVVAILSMPAALVYAATSDSDLADANAEILSAEVALRAGDCTAATRQYATVIQRVADARLAGRATSIALDCGDIDVAARMVTRWRAIARDDPDALRAQVRIGLEREDSKEAGKALAALLATPTVQQAGVPAEIMGLAQASGASRTFLLLVASRSASLATPVAQLALGALALDAWRFRDAARLGAEALAGGADVAAAQTLIARARAGIGEADAALAAAHAARVADATGSAFVEADVLDLLGREDEMRTFVQALESDVALQAEAQRRLAIMAFNRGDHANAQRRFSALLGDEQSAPVAVYYMAMIAERRGDRNLALRGYAMLAGTPFEGASRRRAARLLLASGDRERAIAAITRDASGGITALVSTETDSADLLMDGGDAAGALEQIEAARKRFPEHAGVAYQRAILLERAGRTTEAIGALEARHRAHPRDATLANALGYSLADHGRELPRAERLIRAALAVEPDNPAILDSLGWVKYRRGDAAAALPLFERALRLYRDGDIAAHYGEVLWTSGNVAKAKQIWSAALLRDPDNAMLRDTIKTRAPDLLQPQAPDAPTLDPAAGTQT